MHRRTVNSNGTHRAASICTLVALCMTLPAVVGCKSDPYCETSIANLRAEKIQLENEYYSLKSRYESDMSRLGQPITHDGYYPGGYGGTIMDGEIIEGPVIDGPIIYSDDYGSRQGVQGQLNASLPTVAARSGSGVAGFIRSIEVNQLRSPAADTARLLVRPLDDQGAIIPVAGDIKIRLYDPQTRSTVFENEFSRDKVAGWINDQPGQQPGIHLSIPADGRISLSDKLVCDLQYRTIDNRILKHRTDLILAVSSTGGPAVSDPVTASPAMTTRTGQPARTRPGQPASQNASAPMLPDGIPDDIQIEFGDETNFDSLEPGASSSQRPEWKPDR